jgi:hypothetical protein
MRHGPLLVRSYAFPSTVKPTISPFLTLNMTVSLARRTIATSMTLELSLGSSSVSPSTWLVDADVDAFGEDAGRASEVADAQLTCIEGDSNPRARIVSVQSRIDHQGLWWGDFG